MSRLDDLRADYEARVRLYDLEDRLADVKATGGAQALREHEEELRYARWVQRGGPAEEQQSLATTGQYSSRAAGVLYQRWCAETQGGDQ